jgi:hypothetical protein
MSHLSRTSNMTTALSRNGFRVNRRGFALIWKSDNALRGPSTNFPRPDSHRLDTQHYGLQAEFAEKTELNSILNLILLRVLCASRSLLRPGGKSAF